MGFLINRRNRDISDKDISLIAGTYHNWRTGESEYKDVQGFCKAELEKQIAEEAELNAHIKTNLSKIMVEGGNNHISMEN